LLPLIGETSIQVANGSEGRRRHAMYSRCFTPTAIRRYFDVYNQVIVFFISSLGLCIPILLLCFCLHTCNTCSLRGNCHHSSHTCTECESVVRTTITVSGEGQNLTPATRKHLTDRTKRCIRDYVNCKSLY